MDTLLFFCYIDNKVCGWNISNALLTLPSHRMLSRVYETIKCLSVCPICRQQQQHAAGLLLSAMWAGDID